MVWIAFLLTNIIFGLIFLFLARNQLADLIYGVRHRLAEKTDELTTKSSLEASLNSNLGKLIELDALAEKIIEYRSYNARLRAIRGRQLISRTELEALETRLRELNELQSEGGGGAMAQLEKSLGALNISDQLKKEMAEVEVKINQILERQNKLKDIFSRLEEDQFIARLINQLSGFKLQISAIRGRG